MAVVLSLRMMSGLVGLVVACGGVEDGCPEPDLTPVCRGGCLAPGELLRERSYQGGISATPFALAVDHCGPVVVAGAVGPGDGSSVAWVGKYAADGETLWTAVGPEGGEEHASSVAVDERGRVVVGGAVDVGAEVQAVAVSQTETCALQADGGVRCWGASERWDGLSRGPCWVTTGGPNVGEHGSVAMTEFSCAEGPRCCLGDDEPVSSAQLVPL
ncbi:MAG: hypothetical protein ACRBN8_43430 [Nannocystales bacterium]